MPPKDFKEIIPVFMASDEKYSPFLAVAMCSILKNTNSFIKYYILDGGISKNSRKKIEKSLQEYKNKSVTFIDMKKFSLENFPSLKHYSVNTFSRYFIPELCPHIKKALYLDVDIIMTNDILSLYNQDIGTFPLAAVPEIFYKKNGKYLKENIYPAFKNPDDYFNAGILILDIQKFIENKYSKTLIDKTVKYADKLNCADQDIFNIVFENNYKKINLKYNFIPDFVEFYGEISPVIIHYAGKKPWKFFNAPMKKEFFNISDKTSFSLKIRFILLKNILLLALKNLKSFLYRNIKAPILNLFFNKQK